MGVHRDDGDRPERDRPARHQQKGLVMHTRSGPLSLRTCSICLRVQRRRKWIAAETIILELRSFDRAFPPHLEPALCAVCEEAIHERRVQPVVRLDDERQLSAA
jgi:hypothetical protein